MITLFEFSDIVEDLFLYFNKSKMPDRDKVEIWHKKIQSYSVNQIRSAADGIKDYHDNLPYNIPKAIKRSFIASGHYSGRKERKINEECRGCNSSGAFTVRLRTPEKHGYWYNALVYCGDCQNWKNYCNEPGILKTAAELRMEGTQFKPYNVPIFRREEG